MIQKQDITRIYSALGSILGEAVQNKPLLELAELHNKWFSPEQLSYCLRAWQTALSEQHVAQWLESYSITEQPKQVGIIMAGNLPLVGLHDLLCVIASGHKALVKPSSQDETLMKWVIKELANLHPELENRIIITERLNDADAIIATGSNNSARYFEYYFKNKERIIRKNRSSVAVISNESSDEDLQNLADDIYLYYGMGCRNVSHLLIPAGFDLGRVIRACEKYEHYIHHNKYHNNYVYHKAIILMNLTLHLDSGFGIWQEKTDLHAPVATINYHFYNEPKEVADYIAEHADMIQCVVGKDYLPFGSSQQPGLADYADNIDTMRFLNDL